MYLDTGHLEVDSPGAVCAHTPLGQCLLPGIPLTQLTVSGIWFLPSGRQEGVGSRIKQEGRMVPLLVTLGGGDRLAQ